MKIKWKLDNELLILSLISIFGLIIHHLSFKLHFDGDSYLNLYYFNSQVDAAARQGKTFASVFFTDYGPQGYFFYIIHKIVGFIPIYYYIISFLLRLIAALSSYPFIKNITKNKISGYVSVLFFLIAYTGIEATDWVFNLPSFISIIFINLFFNFLFYKNLTINFQKHLMLIFLLLVATLVQPIRSLFLLPYYGFVLLFSHIYILKKSYYKAILLFVSIMMVFVSLFFFTNIGEDVSIVQKNDQGFLDKLSKTNNTILSPFKTEFSKNNYKILLNPITQLGSLIIPMQILPERYESIETREEMVVLTLVYIFTIITITLLLKKYGEIKNKSYIFFLSSSFIWVVLTDVFFSFSNNFPLSGILLYQLITGGIFLSLGLTLILYNKNKEEVFIFIILSSFLIISYIMPWVRNPLTIVPNNSRYLIIATSGMAYIFGFFARKGSKNIYTLLLILGVIFIHARETYKYFSHLNVVRNYELANQIRKNIPYNSKLADPSYKRPIVYYLDGDNSEILYHSLAFGFPFFLYYNQKVLNPWSFAVTTNFDEVKSAYQDGKSLERFGIKIEPVKIEDIYALKIEGNELKDESDSIRINLKSSIIK